MSSPFLFEGTSYGVGKGDDLTGTQKLRRKNSFRLSLRIFGTDKEPSNEPAKSTILKPKSSLSTLSSKNFDDWEDLDDKESENDSRFSIGALSRLRNAQKRIEKGETPEKIQSSSKNWYEKNSSRCTKAKQLIREKKEKEAAELIQEASEDDFPSATFEFFKQALKNQQMTKANFFFRLTCQQLRQKADLLDNQHLIILAEGIKSLVKEYPLLQKIFEEFKGASYFQKTERERPLTPPKSLTPPRSFEEFTDSENSEEYGDTSDFDEKFKLKLLLLSGKSPSSQSPPCSFNTENGGQTPPIPSTSLSPPEKQTGPDEEEDIDQMFDQ